MSTKLVNANDQFFKEVFGGLSDTDTCSDGGNSLKNRSRVKTHKRFNSLDLKVKLSKPASTKAIYHLTDHYEFIENLGIGTYSYVKHAVDKITDEHVAIKICRRQTSRNMLKNEYELLKRISSSSVIKVFDLIENDAKDESYMIMEYFEGASLNEHIENHGTFNSKEAILVIQQLSDCVRSLHEAGICHRDIKPENILVNAENEIKLIDFNISK